jgi:uncharacterized membrane protein
LVIPCHRLGSLHRAFISSYILPISLPISYASSSLSRHHNLFLLLHFYTFAAMVVVTRPPANGFVAAVRKLYNPVGFGKGYNFVLWVILAGAMMGFCLARLMYLDFDNIMCPSSAPAPGAPVPALPTECYWYQSMRSRVGIMMHLAGILPAGILVTLQFTPVIRHKFLLFHRINGYVVILLSITGTAGALMMARYSFGEALETQVAAGVASIMFMVSLGIALYNIKKLQIEQHRAWMLRAWVNASFIITMRLIGAIMSPILSALGETYYGAMPCTVLDYVFRGNQTRVLDGYPGCNNFYSGIDPHAHVAIGGDTNDKANIERLRRISYQRQVEAGMRNPGNAGLTVQRCGDAEPWVAPDSATAVEVHYAKKQQSVRGSNDISI